MSTNLGDESPVTLQVLKREIDAALGLIQADPINLAAALVAIVERAQPQDRSAVLQHLFENPLHFDRDNQASREIKLSPSISNIELDALRRKYASVVDSMLDLTLYGKPTVSDFYAAIASLFENPIFQGPNTRAFLLHWLLIDKRLPYFQLVEGLRMSNDDFKNLGSELARQRAYLRFILASEVEQRSEQADLVLRVLDEYQGPERVRLMAFVLWETRRSGRSQDVSRTTSVSGTQS